MEDNQRRVLVLNGFGNNLGDQAIFSGFVEVFGAAADAHKLDVALDQSFIYSYAFREQNIEQINRTYDLIVMGGGGIIFHRPEDKSPSGWGFNIPLELVDRLTVPFAVYAAGYNCCNYSSSKFPKETETHLQKVVAKAAHFSLREHGSIERVRQEMHIDGPISFVPDAALHVRPLPIAIPGLRPERKQIGLCLRLDRVQERFPPPSQERFTTFLKELLGAMKRLVNEDGYQVVFIPHLLTQLDQEVGQMLKRSLPQDGLVLIHEALPQLFRGAKLEYAQKLSGIYEQMDVVLGKRLHSVILPFAVGTPVVAISSTPSNRWMLREFGAPDHHYIDINDFDREVRADRIRDALLDASRRREEIRAQYAKRREELIEQACKETHALVQNCLVTKRRAA